jgi:O-acetyl-ADP-ribose deacetylase (regulator of RNase III)
MATANANGIRVECGDLTAQTVDAIVFYAREDLQLGSGFGGAIRSRGGAAIQKELDAAGGVAIGEAVVTSGGALAARHVIHACGPKFQEPDLAGKLRRCMDSALQAAERLNARSVAFPAMGAGFYGIPLDLCASVMLQSIAESQRSRSVPEEILICVRDRRELQAFQARLAAR